MSDLRLDEARLCRRFVCRHTTLAEFFNQALREYAKRQGKSRWAEKTPNHLFQVDRILAWYPEARIVCIMRDGRDATLSLMRLPWAIKSCRAYATVWKKSATYAERWMREYPQNFLALKFEDLVTAPSTKLAEVMQFIGVDFESAQLDVSKTSGVVPDWEKMWKGKVNSSLDPSRILAWKKTISPRQLRIMTSIMGKHLEEFGYQPQYLPVPWPIRIYDFGVNSAFAVLFDHRFIRHRRAGRRVLAAIQVCSKPARQLFYSAPDVLASRPTGSDVP